MPLSLECAVIRSYGSSQRCVLNVFAGLLTCSTAHEAWLVWVQ